MLASCSVCYRQESVLFKDGGSTIIVPGVTKWADLLNLRITCLSAAGPAHPGVRPVSIGFLCTSDRRADGHMRRHASNQGSRVRAIVTTRTCLPCTRACPRACTRACRAHVLVVHTCLPCSINGLRSVSMAGWWIP